MPDGLKRYHNFEHDHFITFSCYRRLPYLNTDIARITFEDLLEESRKRYRFCIYAYVLMPEHVHLLLGKPAATPLPTVLNVLKTQTSRRLKTAESPFWQTRYYDRNIFTSAEFLEKRRYIHRNPVQRGLVVTPEDWPWSSYRHFTGNQPGRVTISTSFADTPNETTGAPSVPLHGTGG